jgi:ribose 5-phosphate isomerase A
MRSSASVTADREAAAAAAAQLVEPDMTIGLGSGRAVWAVVERLPEGTRAVVASERTSERALTAGIEVVELDGSIELDLALDGADEVDGSLGLIKGGGGALLREKIVIAAARRFVVVAEAPKKVERLGERVRMG